MQREKVAKPIMMLFIPVCLLAMITGLPAMAGINDNNVVIVLDASGSMNNSMGGTTIKKLDAAKSALREVLKEVPMDTNIGLLVFSSKNASADWLYRLGPREDTRLLMAINQLKAGGKTPLGEYIKKGADRLLEKRTEQFNYGTYRLLIVTDGEASDTNLLHRYLPDVLSRGITIDVIGVDMAGNHTLANQVHSYRRADDPSMLKKAVAEVFAEVADMDSGAADEDAFSQIAPIPNEMATAMLKALSSSGNHPIGDQPRAATDKASEEQNGVMADQAEKKPKSDKHRGTGLLKTLIILVAFFVILWALFKRGKKS